MHDSRVQVQPDDTSRSRSSTRPQRDPHIRRIHDKRHQNRAQRNKNTHRTGNAPAPSTNEHNVVLVKRGLLDGRHSGNRARGGQSARNLCVAQEVSTSLQVPFTKSGRAYLRKATGGDGGRRAGGGSGESEEREDRWGRHDEIVRYIYQRRREEALRCSEFCQRAIV